MHESPVCMSQRATVNVCVWGNGRQEEGAEFSLLSSFPCPVVLSGMSVGSRGPADLAALCLWGCLCTWPFLVSRLAAPPCVWWC